MDLIHGPLSFNHTNLTDAVLSSAPGALAAADATEAQDAPVEPAAGAPAAPAVDTNEAPAAPVELAAGAPAAPGEPGAAVQDALAVDKNGVPAVPQAPVGTVVDRSGSPASAAVQGVPAVGKTGCRAVPEADSSGELQVCPQVPDVSAAGSSAAHLGDLRLQADCPACCFPDLDAPAADSSGGCRDDLPLRAGCLASHLVQASRRCCREGLHPLRHDGHCPGAALQPRFVGVRRWSLRNWNGPFVLPVCAAAGMR
jgi:hypothetical protein